MPNPAFKRTGCARRSTMRSTDAPRRGKIKGDAKRGIDTNIINRRLIVQFDPDEPSMSAPTFAEPDQGPLAGGRKVNARHDLTLGLWRRDCEISRGFPRR